MIDMVLLRKCFCTALQANLYTNGPTMAIDAFRMLLQLACQKRRRLSPHKALLTPVLPEATGYNITYGSLTF